ncbi:hypothetical protein NE562_09650 [Butyricicoccus faecihominis]|uniref:hypothetical protein n=1 Tax=Butyricicoccus faecihominis TaxID=1712515 RepID=UPI002478FC68|nr:hypothetical protein [Butyricicoccus faecihominis]MCQ5129924.1 hypothetical protein [Butyricicoccus faecihominis]
MKFKRFCIFMLTLCLTTAGAFAASATNEIEIQQGTNHSFTYENGNLIAIDDLPYSDSAPQVSAEPEDMDLPILRDGIYVPKQWCLETDKGTNGVYRYHTNEQEDTYSVRTAVSTINLENAHSVTASISGSVEFGFEDFANANMSYGKGETYKKTVSIVLKNPAVGYKHCLKSWVNMQTKYYIYLKPKAIGNGYTIYRASTTEPYGTDYDIYKVAL